MSARYDWRSVTQNLPAGASRVQYFAGDQRRVSVGIASTIGGNVTIGNSPGAGPDGLWGGTQGTGTLVFPWRDWGPPVKDAIFVGNAAAVARDITVTEIFIVGRC